MEDDASMEFVNVIHPRNFIERKIGLKLTIVLEGATNVANEAFFCGMDVETYALLEQEV